VLRRLETRIGLNSGLTFLARRDQTGKNAAPLSPKPQGAGSIPVPPAPGNPKFMGIAASCLQSTVGALTPICRPFDTTRSNTAGI
jgi:hypothetical protein